MRRRRKIEESLPQDRWMVSFADFMTLLFALFVVLFASTYRDKQSVQRVSTAVKDGFQQMGTFSDSNPVPQVVIPTLSKITQVAGSTGTGGENSNRLPGIDGIDVDALQKKLHQALGHEIEQKQVVMRMTPEGFVITLPELGFFNSGEARLLPGAADKIKRISAVLMEYGLDMRVEGHSDNVPIHDAAFASNWDLSTARATAVAMMLVNEAGFDPERMSIAGYGQYHPTASNETPEGRRANRRVDIVVLSTSTSRKSSAP